MKGFVAANEQTVLPMRKMRIEKHIIEDIEEKRM